MSHTVHAHPLRIQPRQTLDLPLYTGYLSVTLDKRHNNCLLTTLQDDEQASIDKTEIVMLRLYETLTPANGRFIGSFADNTGAVFVFAVRESDSIIKPAKK